jgi:hypothetical protein
VLLGAPRAAGAQSSWSELPLPGGRAELLPRLGLRADLPRALVVGEIVRTVHQARDPKSQILATLNAYFATPPATGDETVPVPLAPDVWREQILLRAVPDHDLLGAIFADRRAALLCYGLLGLDRETLAFVAGSPALLKRLYERDASPFAGYAHVLRVRNGALELPGGAEAAPIWDALAGTPTADAASGIVALLTRDNARLAYFAEALETLDSAHLALVFPPNATPDARAAAAHPVYRSFVTVDALRDLADLPFQRVSDDPGALLAALPLNGSGTIEGTASYWRALIDGTNVPEDPADEWPDLENGDAGMAAPVLAHLAAEALPGRRELLATLDFVARMQRRMREATPVDRVLLAHAFRRYPALMLTLERIGVADLNVWKAMVQRARRLDVRSGADADVPLSLFQAPIALVDRAVLVGGLDSTTATGLLTKLADIDVVRRWWVTWHHPEGSPLGRAVGLWIERDLLPALAGKPHVGPGEAETALVEALAGFTADAPAIEAPHLRWEDYDYRVDPAVAEVVRLRAARNRQGGNTLDIALALTHAGSALAEAHDRAAVQAAHAVLAAARDQLEPLDIDDREPALAPPSITRIVDQALSDATRVGAHDGKAGPTIASRLSRAEDETLADVLRAFVYALWVGDPDGQVLAGGNVARRHEFGRGTVMSEELRRLRWQLPAESSGAREPWHLRGSLLAIDIALGRLALRRTSIDLPPQQPRLNEGDRRVFIASLVLTPAGNRTVDGPRTLLDWLNAGRQVVDAATAPDTRERIVSRLGLDRRRAEALAWTADHDPRELYRLFLTTEIAALGRPAGAASPENWGTAQIALNGCLCRVFPDTPAPHRAEGRVGSGLLATAIDDLELQILESLDELHVPLSLTRGVMSAALQDFLDGARPAYLSDWLSLAGQVRDLPRERVIDYIAAQTADGPLVPAGASPDSNGPR